MRLQSYSIPNTSCIIAKYHLYGAHACHKMFSKGQNVNILIILHVHLKWFLTVLVDNHVLETVPRRYAKRVCCKKSPPVLMWFEWNVPPVELVKVFKPFCFRSVFSSLLFLSRFPTLVGNLSFFALSFLLYYYYPFPSFFTTIFVLQ